MDTYDDQALADWMIQNMRDRWKANKRGELSEGDIPPPDSFEARYWTLMDDFQGAADFTITSVTGKGVKGAAFWLLTPETS